MVDCKICDRSFKGNRGLHLHVARGHKIDWDKYQTSTKEQLIRQPPKTRNPNPEFKNDSTDGFRVENLRQTYRKNNPFPTEPPPPTPTETAVNPVLPEVPAAFEQEIWFKATPLIRKVALNPEMYFWYDYAKGNLDFKGDIGDFVSDCVRFFFKSHGYKISIVREEEMS